MSDLFLDLRDKPRVVDFLVMAGAYAGEKDRKAADALVSAYQDGKHPSIDKLANAARKLAFATWSARYAVVHYVMHEGSDEEWTRIVAAVRPSTAHLMKRFRAGVKAKTLDEVLNHPDVATALHDEEMLEIAEVRTHVREDLWKEKGTTLSLVVKQGAQELAAYRKRLDALRELAAAFPPALQDEIFSKINHYEDRILFAGEVLPLEILNGEVSYYTDQKEITPLDRSRYPT